jgi:hypothetical protein
VKTRKHNNLCLFCSIKRCYGLAHPTKTYLWNDTCQWNCKEICTTNFRGKEPYESCSQSLEPSSSTQITMTISTNSNDKLPLKLHVVIPIFLLHLLLGLTWAWMPPTITIVHKWHEKHEKVQSIPKHNWLLQQQVVTMMYLHKGFH